MSAGHGSVGGLRDSGLGAARPRHDTVSGSHRTSTETVGHAAAVVNRPAEVSFGGFGENLTILNLTEADVCIGDIWQIGDVVRVQVSQPRQPCWKLARRWKIKTLALQVQQTGRSGWYYRVLTKGAVESGMSVSIWRTTRDRS